MLALFLHMKPVLIYHFHCHYSKGLAGNFCKQYYSNQEVYIF